MIDKLDPDLYKTCPVCEQPTDRHRGSCAYFEPYADPDRQPVWPFTGFEAKPKTNEEEARRSYVEAMHAMQMHEWYTRKGKAKEAADWLEIFKGYRDICTSYDRDKNRQPLTQKWVAQRCSTPDCRGLFWTNNVAKWLASQSGRSQPSGKCTGCLNKDTP